MSGPPWCTVDVQCWLGQGKRYTVGSIVEDMFLEHAESRLLNDRAIRPDCLPL